MNEYKLTNYSHGAGCGCKISPSVLSEIIGRDSQLLRFPKLLVGNNHRDDAAVFEIVGGQAIVSTVDFFTPIIDNAYDFGRIAAVNAISDIYAMGAKPLLAIGILGWPTQKLPIELARLVLDGGREICDKANIPLAGGHSIDSLEPLFGLCVTGIINKQNIKTNSNAKVNDLIYLTKPLGIGILTTAEKKGLLEDSDRSLALANMLKLNKIGEEFGELDYVHTMTDVTGFGFLGHLNEICIGSKKSALINFDSIKLINPISISRYINLGCVPGGTKRNWSSYSSQVSILTDFQINILCDPQTSGGLLVTIDNSFSKEFQDVCIKHKIDLEPIGSICEKRKKNILVK